MHYADRLARLIDERGPICAGLDPRENALPPEHSPSMWARKVVNTLLPHVAAFKPNLAFWGDNWLNVASAVMPLIGDEVPLLDKPIVIADCKRGDIGSSAAAYAESIFLAHPWVDAITVNPFLGEDSLQPFVDAAVKFNKGIFVLVRTSNPGADDIQSIMSMGMDISERAAWMVNRLNEDTPKGRSGYPLVGAVVGMTVDAETVSRLRAIMQSTFFLMPGYGAQGGDPAVLAAARDSRGGGVLVNASRSLTLPWSLGAKDISSGEMPTDWEKRIEIECKLMKKELEGK